MDHRFVGFSITYYYASIVVNKNNKQPKHSNIEPTIHDPFRYQTGHFDRAGAHFPKSSQQFDKAAKVLKWTV